jgi:hypothetical protein
MPRNFSVKLELDELEEDEVILVRCNCGVFVVSGVTRCIDEVELSATRGVRSSFRRGE